MSRLSADTTWAVQACAEAELGALRRTKRLRALATVLAQNPRASLPEARGNSARLKAAYRFFANEAMAPQDILPSHIEAPYGRLDTVPVVLAGQDTPAVHWTSLRATTGLGPLGPTAYRGLCVHSPLAITPARVPLGLLAQQVWAREAHLVGLPCPAHAAAHHPARKSTVALEPGGGLQRPRWVSSDALCQRRGPGSRHL